jgi:hypothetical protein
MYPGFLCERWNQKAVKSVDTHTFAKQAEKLKKKHFLPARKLIATVFWDMKWVLRVEWLQQETLMS